jgi:DNA-binding response OmpR family regulator
MGAVSTAARVLVIEDAEAIGAAVGSALRDAGYQVQLRADGRELENDLARFRPDLVVLDVMLPGRDGFMLLEVVRRASSAGVVMLTARDGVSDRLRGLDRGADDYLVKPFVLAELEARLRALARRGAVPRPTLLRAGSLVLDPARRTVSIDSDPVNVTAREFSLLEYFLRRIDSVLPRTRIIDEVWDFAFDGDPRIVDVYVRVLRKKLQHRRGAPRIETVRGSGYVLRAPGSQAQS